MNSPQSTTVRQPARKRGLFITLLAFVIIVISALLMPISAITLLMILAGSHGTSTFDPLGFLGTVVAPAASLAAGVGLLLRRKWARYYFIALFGLFITYSAWRVTSGHHETTTHTSSTGVKTAVPTSFGGSSSHRPLLFVSAVVLAGLCRRSVREEFNKPVASAPDTP